MREFVIQIPDAFSELSASSSSMHVRDQNAILSLSLFLSDFSFAKASVHVDHRAPSTVVAICWEEETHPKQLRPISTAIALSDMEMELALALPFQLSPRAAVGGVMTDREEE